MEEVAKKDNKKNMEDMKTITKEVETATKDEEEMVTLKNVEEELEDTSHEEKRSKESSPNQGVRELYTERNVESNLPAEMVAKMKTMSVFCMRCDQRNNYRNIEEEGQKHLKIMKENAEEGTFKPVTVKINHHRRMQDYAEVMLMIQLEKCDKDLAENVKKERIQTYVYDDIHSGKEDKWKIHWKFMDHHVMNIKVGCPEEKLATKEARKDNLVKR